MNEGPLSEIPEGPDGPGTDASLAQRYAIAEELGRGGMAVVYAATDGVSAQRVAIKRLKKREGTAFEADVVSMFEQEFHVLSELAHPHVVKVFDYGVADSAPYYTMELLDGGDLAQLSPMAPSAVCRVFRQVCSVLALLHSRRLVYRDLNPKNIRCTRSGVAKVIDFGAMVPMGQVPKLVGTLGFVAPEFLQQQSVDGRADLYAVGACMYHALTGGAPHRARTFAELAVRIRATPRRPSQLREAELPASLEELVMELLQVEPAHRPACAAEVMERLTTIGALPEHEGLPVASAYLATPPLVGRDDGLSALRKAIRRTKRGRGSAQLFEASPGAGRTRMLEAAALEAKLGELVAVRAGAGDAQAGEYGVADALTYQLLELHPEAAALAALHAPVLGHALPSLRRAFPQVALKPFADPRLRRPAVQAGLRSWLFSVARARPIALVVDDVHRIDEPSLALLALAATEIHAGALLLVCSAEQAADCPYPAPFFALRERANALPLNMLSSHDTHALVAATFGDSPKLSLLSARIFSACQGNPRDAMQLAQFVVGQGIVRYEGGRWLLPQKLHANVLPRTAEAASARILAGLSEAARDLARLLATCTLPALSFDACVDLRGGQAGADTLRALGELAAAEVVRLVDTRYSLSRPMWAATAVADLTRADLEVLHGRIASMMARRGHPALLRVRHLQQAGETRAALDTMVTFCRDSIQQTDDDGAAFLALIGSLPDGWYDLFNWAIETAEAQQTPLADVCVMRLRLAALLGLDPTTSAVHIAVLMDQQRHDTGLDLCAALAEEGLEPEAVLQQALAGAQARFDAAPEDRRWLAPLAALRTLVQTEIMAASFVVSSMNYELLEKTPDLRLFEALAPAIAIVRLMIDGLRYRMAGRSDQTAAAYEDLLARMDGPDNGGIGPTHASFARLGVLRGLAIMEAVIGHDGALKCADLLARKSPLLPMQPFHMLYCYFDGRPRDGDVFKREAALERIGTGLVHHEGPHLPAEISAHASARDATRLRETLREVEVHAGRHPGWQPVLCYGQAELLRLRNKHGRAEAMLAAQLADLQAGEHLVWCNLAGAHLATMVATGQSEQAVTLGERYLSQARAGEQGINEVFIRVPLAQARLLAADPQGAWSEVQGVLEVLHARSARGLLLAGVHEVAATIALARDEPNVARLHVEACEAHLRVADNRIGRSRCQRLRRALEGASAAQSADSGCDVAQLLSEIRSEILRDRCEPVVAQTWHRALLARIVSATGAEGGALFVPTAPDSGTGMTGQSTGAELAAAEGVSPQLAAMGDLARACCRQHQEFLSLAGGDEVLETRTELGPDVAHIFADALEALPLRHMHDEVPHLAAVVVLARARCAAQPQLLEAISRLIEASGAGSGTTVE